MLFVVDIDLAVLQLYLLAGYPDDAFDVKIILIVGRTEDDDVAAFRRTQAMAEKRVITDFFDNEIFAETILARIVNVIERVAHRGAVDLEGGDQVGANRVHQNDDDDDIDPEVEEKIQRHMFLPKVVEKS